MARLHQVRSRALSTLSLMPPFHHIFNSVSSTVESWLHPLQHTRSLTILLAIPARNNWLWYWFPRQRRRSSSFSHFLASPTVLDQLLRHIKYTWRWCSSSSYQN
jgi:hypothetical protein